MTTDNFELKARARKARDATKAQRVQNKRDYMKKYKADMNEQLKNMRDARDEHQDRVRAEFNDQCVIDPRIVTVTLGGTEITQCVNVMVMPPRYGENVSVVQTAFVGCKTGKRAKAGREM
jgi:hypothetical protein